MSAVPSPCVDVCKYRKNGLCIGCAMTEREKKAFKTLEGKARRRAFLAALIARQAETGDFRHWQKAYARKCRKKGVAAPLA